MSKGDNSNSIPTKMTLGQHQRSPSKARHRRPKVPMKVRETKKMLKEYCNSLEMILGKVRHELMYFEKAYESLTKKWKK